MRWYMGTIKPVTALPAGATDAFQLLRKHHKHQGQQRQ
jgi:hypothetical protein